MEKEIFDDKIGILDIKAKLNDNTNCDIEMQVVDRRNIEKRVLYYWSKLYSQSIKEGNDYEKLEKAIVVLFVDYELELLKEISEYLTIWNIREAKYPQYILTNDFEIYIIEITKFEKLVSKGSPENLWVKFITNPGVVNMENKEIEKAKKILEEISQDEKERYVAELRQKYIMDQKAIEGAGYDKGVKIGKELGKELGKKQNQVEIAKKMIKKGLDIDTIIELTELTKEEIEEIM